MRGGVGAYTALLAQHLRAAGQEIFLFSTREAQSSNLTLQNNLSGWGPASLGAVRAWSKQFRVDVINLQFQTAAYAMSPWIHFLPDVVRATPVITTFHDLRFPYLFPKAGRLRNWIVLHLAQVSAGAIVTNHEDFAALHPISRRQLIPIGSNITQLLPTDFDASGWRQRAGAQPGDLLLAYFGLVNRSKGVDDLLRCLAILRSEHVPARLVIIGGTAGSSDPTNQTYLNEIEQMIRALDLERHIHRTGYLENEAEVAAYLRASDAVILPFQDGASYRRGSLMAAIHYGCPIITTEPSVPIPAFVQGENLLLVPPGAPHRLAEAVRQLHASPSLGQKLRQGAAHLSTTFHWPQIASDYIHFFQRVLGDKT
jgi:glycosyltransferase involved in cell wall biosynthesis